MTWTFPAGGDLAEIAARLAEAVSEYGVPFIDKYADWSVYSAEIESSGLLMEHERAKILPVVAALNGDRERADEMIREELARIADAEDMYSSSYRRFADRFAKKKF